MGHNLPLAHTTRGRPDDELVLPIGKPIEGNERQSTLAISASLLASPRWVPPSCVLCRGDKSGTFNAERTSM